MRINFEQNIMRHHKAFLILVVTGSIMLFSQFSVMAQEHPPRPINITFGQGIQFGTFYHGPLGGTVVVTTDGTRSSTGDVFLFGFTSSPLTFLIDANPGTIISVLPIPQVTLTGTTGGSMTMDIDSSDPITPFVATTSSTQIRFGGTLNVANPLANPPGSYSATFFVTFNQE